MNIRMITRDECRKILEPVADAVGVDVNYVAKVDAWPDRLVVESFIVDSDTPDDTITRTVHIVDSDTP